LFSRLKGWPENVAFGKFNVTTELKKAARGRKLKVDPYVLLSLIAEKHLALTAAEREHTDTAWLTALWRLADPR